MTHRAQNLAAKYKWILAQERAWAGSLAASIHKPRRISVWEVLMPLLLIFNYAGLKVSRETFVQNNLFTKQLALNAARDILEKPVSRGAAMAPVKQKTRDLLSTVEEGVYSEAIREKQLYEIDLLVDHYCLLMESEGRDYDSLVRGVYRDRRSYLGFLNRLQKAEQEVNAASLKTVGSRGDPLFVSKLEETMETLRMATVERIFGGDG